jgi:hypothetical protein
MKASDNKNFSFVPNRDSNGDCIPKHANYTAAANLNSPAKQVIANPARVGELFSVKDADGNDVLLSAEWIAGFVDGEGTLTFFLNKNSDLALGFQLQSAFIIVQGESDYLLLTAIANFFGYGTVNVNRKDSTSVRYQYRIVDTTTQVNLIIPFFEVTKLRTKKGKEFIVWAEWTKFFAEGKHKESWPTGMISLLEGLKSLKYVGAQTSQAESFIASCDKWIAHVKSVPKPNFK